VSLGSRGREPFFARSRAGTGTSRRVSEEARARHFFAHICALQWGLSPETSGKRNEIMRLRVVKFLRKTGKENFPGEIDPTREESENEYECVESAR